MTPQEEERKRAGAVAFTGERPARSTQIHHYTQTNTEREILQELDLKLRNDSGLKPASPSKPAAALRAPLALAFLQGVAHPQPLSYHKSAGLTNQIPITPVPTMRIRRRRGGKGRPFAPGGPPELPLAPLLQSISQACLLRYDPTCETATPSLSLITAFAGRRSQCWGVISCTLTRE